MEGNGDVILFGDLQAEVYYIGIGALVFMDFHAAGAGFYVAFYRGGVACGASALDSQVYGDLLKGLEVLMNGEVAVVIQPCAYEGGNTGTYGGLHEFGVVVDVDVTIYAARSSYQASCGEDIGVRAQHKVDAIHDVGVPGPPDSSDQAILDADVALEDAKHGIDDDGANDDAV